MARLDKRSAALLALLFALGAAYYLVEMRGAPRRDAARARAGALFPLAQGEVAGIELSSGVRLARAGDRFEIVRPLDAPADPAAVARLLDALLGATCESRFEAPAESLAAFGLDAPRAWCAIDAFDGTKRIVDLGAETPAGNRLYVRERGAAEICVVWGSLLRECQRRPEDLRDRRLVSAAPRDVTTLRIERPAGTLVIERDAPRGWRIAGFGAQAAAPRAEPDAAPRPAPSRGGRASSEAVAALLERLAQARVLAFADGAAPDSLQDLAAATLRRAVFVRAHAGASPASPAAAVATAARAETLVVGFPAGPGDFPVAIRSPLQPRPAAVDLDLVALLDVPVDSLLETRLLLAAPERVRRLVVERPSGRIALERSGEGWSVVAPETLTADPVLARALLRNLDNERIVAWRPDLTPAAAGLDAPRARLRLEFEEPLPRDEILLGADAPGGVFAAFAGDSAVFVVSARFVSILPDEPARLETREILAAPLEAARTLTLAFEDGTPLRLVRRDGAWADAQERIPSARAAAIAHDLSRLTPVDRVPIGEDAARLGFDASVLTAEWDGPRGGRLEIASPLDPTRRFGRLSRARGVIYLFLESDIDSLRRLAIP